MTPQEAKTKVDNYIAAMPDNFRLICEQIRQIILQADPEIRETWKWSAPVYEKNQLICSFSAFKKHVRFSFFQGVFLTDPANIFKLGEGNATMQSINYTEVSQLNEAVLSQYVREAANLPKSPVKADTKELAAPADLITALASSEAAQKAFQKLSHTHRKEYIVWIESAKKEETRQRRIAKTLVDLVAGKMVSAG